VDVGVADIRGSSPAPSRSSRGVAPIESMRAWWQEGAIAGLRNHTFRAAIRNDNDLDRVREPWWYAVRFYPHRAQERLLRILGFDYRLFTYTQRRPRKRPVIRNWLPGYFFVEFDAYDDWAQLSYIPGVIEVLRTPITYDEIESLTQRLPTIIEPAGENESIARGTVVRVKNGTFQGYTAPVIWSERKRAKIMTMMFGRPLPAEFRTRDVEIVS
jgi:transcription antitermination factor NusG